MSKKNISIVIFEDLKKRIASGEFKIEERLPNERQLAEHYDASRIPVREAIKELTKEGIVKTAPSVGTFVIGTVNALKESASNAFSVNQNNILLESVRIRRLIEAEAARKAALNATPEGIDRIQTALFETITEIRKLKEGQENHFFEADLAFHRYIAQEAQEDFYIKCLDAMPESISSHQYWSLKNTTPRDEVISYHTQIFESILDKNDEKAGISMYNHLSRVEQLLCTQAKKTKVNRDE